MSNLQSLARQSRRRSVGSFVVSCVQGESRLEDSVIIISIQIDCCYIHQDCSLFPVPKINQTGSKRLAERSDQSSNYFMSHRESLLACSGPCPSSRFPNIARSEHSAPMSPNPHHHEPYPWSSRRQHHSHNQSTRQYGHVAQQAQPRQ